MFPQQIQRIKIGRRTIGRCRPCQPELAERSYRTPLGTVTRVKSPSRAQEVIRHLDDSADVVDPEAVLRAPRAGGDHCSKNG
jgi:hypothetical protein